VPRAGHVTLEYRDENVKFMESVDIAVVGAGFAGLTVARELGNAGFDVVVLEARNRVGGRTWTDHRLGHELEMGANWIHWVQPHVWAEMTRYGRRIVRSPKAEEVYWLGADGSTRTGTVEDVMALVEGGHDALLADVQEAIPRGVEPTVGSIHELDKFSIQDRFESVDIDPESRNANECIWVGHVNAPLDQAGLSYALRWTAVTGGYWRLSHDAAATYRIEGGMNSLSQALAADVRGAIRLNTVVSSVVQDNDGVIVETGDGGRIRARRVVSTLPVNASAGIRFEPPLPEVWQRLAAETVASQGVKVWLRARGHLPRFFAYATQHSPLSILKAEFYGTDEHGEDYTIIVGFGADHKRIDIDDLEGIQAAVDVFRPGIEVTEVTGHDWMKDPYSMNTWMTHRPGQLTESLEELQQPQARLHFASADNASLWGGHVDGAIESGLREARRIIEALAEKA
jgi:monoamine oxidase